MSSKAIIVEETTSKPSKVALIHQFVINGDEFNLRFELNQQTYENYSIKDKRYFHVDDLNSQTGRTALVEAVANDQFEIVKMLIEEFHCNVNKRSSLGKSTPLHVAVEFGFRQIAMFLILNNADVNAKDRNGDTPLHLLNSLGMAKMLQKFGADCLIRNNKGDQSSASYKRKSLINDCFNQGVYTFLSEWEYKIEMEKARQSHNNNLEV